MAGSESMRRVLRERWPGETRWVVVEQDRPVEIHLHRDHERLRLGSCHPARVLSLEDGRYRMACDAQEAWLKNVGPTAQTHHPIGSLYTVRVVREEIAEPGHKKRAHVAILSAGHRPDSTAQEVLDDLGPGEVCDAHDRLLMDEWLECAISGDIPFPGGRLSVERTRGGVMIDVDGHGDSLTLNQAAAQMIAYILRLFQIGGKTIVDFVSLTNKAQRRCVDAQLRQSLAADPRPAECTAMNGYGTVEIIRARTKPSVIDHMCGTRRHAPSPETEALQMLRWAVQSQGIGLRSIYAPARVVDVVSLWPEALREAEHILGAPIALVVHTATPAHVHVLPR